MKENSTLKILILSFLIVLIYSKENDFLGQYDQNKEIDSSLEEPLVIDISIKDGEVSDPYHIIQYYYENQQSLQNQTLPYDQLQQEINQEQNIIYDYESYRDQFIDLSSGDKIIELLYQVPLDIRMSIPADTLLTFFPQLTLDSQNLRNEKENDNVEQELFREEDTEIEKKKN